MNYVAGVHANGIIATLVFIEVCQLCQKLKYGDSRGHRYRHCLHAHAHTHRYLRKKESERWGLRSLRCLCVPLWQKEGSFRVPHFRSFPSWAKLSMLQCHNVFDLPFLNISSEILGRIPITKFWDWIWVLLANYVGHLESKERLRIQPAQLFNFSWWVMWCVQ